MNRVAAVVVTYNRCSMLVGCIEQLLNQKEAICDILVVDNASTDDTATVVGELTQTNSEQVQYRNTGKNIGGAGGFNFGVRWAAEAGYDWIWLMDDDTYPEPDALEQLLKADELLEGNYAFLSSAALWTDGAGCIMNRPGIYSKYEEEITRLTDGILRIEQATFVSMFLKRETVLACGLPIREFFIWGDDIEYSRRICIRYGLPAYLVARSQVVHMMKENKGSNLYMDVPERISRYQLAFRNESYLYRKEGIRGFIYYLIRCAANFKNIIFRAKDHRCRRFKALLVGMAQGIVFNPKVESASVTTRGDEKQDE